jgi:hypothetical protein
MGAAGDDYKHAVRGSFSRGPWNKCGNRAIDLNKFGIMRYIEQ